MSECIRDGCDTERMNAHGSLGRFCSKACRREHTTDTPDVSGVAEAIARLD